ncbi:MAG: hypothetical protein AB8G77_22605 [Rhodothermales bacterium]
MKTTRFLLIGIFAFSPSLQAQVMPLKKTSDLVLQDAAVRYTKKHDYLVFEQTVKGIAGRTTPKSAGQMDGAPVLGHVFPTTLKPADVGFRGVSGIVALAVTSHPDFDDTPLWDENGNSNYEDDGLVYHTHWVTETRQTRTRRSGGSRNSQRRTSQRTPVNGSGYAYVPRLARFFGPT